jgi:hypothetical protein
MAARYLEAGLSGSGSTTRGRRDRQLSDQQDEVLRILQEAEVSDTAEVSDQEKIANLLKLTKSFEVDLVPGTQQDLDKKAFNWTVSEMSGSQISFDFSFENPEYISMGDRADYMNVKFHNTDVYLVPTDGDK